MAIASRAEAVSAPKLASMVARRIEDDIAEAGWPVGAVLGSEADLLDRYGVSRAVLREAIRILEHTGAASMRRGPGGGLVVASPDRGAVVAATGIWFSYVGATIGEMMEVRRPLIVAAIRLAAERCSEEDGARLQSQVEEIAAMPGFGPTELAELEAAIGAVARNPALSMFIDAVGDLGMARLANGTARLEPAPTTQELRGHLDGYRSLLQLIGSGDGDSAASLMNGLLDAVASRFHDVPGVAEPSLERSDGKLAERVARVLRDDIEAHGWDVGSLLGSESDLVDRLGVSRTILREAVRILEHHGAVRTKRGPNGGIIVDQPDHSAIVRSARLVLEFEGVTASQLFEVRSVLEVAAARLAARRIDGTNVDHLERAIAAEDGTSAAEHFMPVHRVIAAATGNRLYSLFVDVMGDLVPQRVGPDHRAPDAMSTLSSAVHHAHERIVAAVVAGDADLAGDRMLRHLQASVDVLR